MVKIKEIQNLIFDHQYTVNITRVPFWMTKPEKKDTMYGANITSFGVVFEGVAVQDLGNFLRDILSDTLSSKPTIIILKKYF